MRGHKLCIHELYTGPECSLSDMVPGRGAMRSPLCFRYSRLYRVKGHSLGPFSQPDPGLTVYAPTRLQSLVKLAPGLSGSAG